MSPSALTEHFNFADDISLSYACAIYTYLLSEQNDSEDFLSSGSLRITGFPCFSTG